MYIYVYLYIYIYSYICTRGAQLGTEKALVMELIHSVQSAVPISDATVDRTEDLTQVGRYKGFWRGREGLGIYLYMYMCTCVHVIPRHQDTKIGVGTKRTCRVRQRGWTHNINATPGCGIVRAPRIFVCLMCLRR